MDTLRQNLQAGAEHLVIIPPQRIARYIGELRIRQHLTRLPPPRPIVEPGSDDAYRARHQFRRTRPHQAMAGHIIHLPMEAGSEPSQQAILLIGEINARYGNGFKAQFGTPALDLLI